jgi:hypothetical protein
LKFKDREGHCIVSQKHVEDGYRLGQWVAMQRQAKSDLTDDRLRRLYEIGFVWDPYIDKWEAGYAALLKFKDREGHCRVPTNLIEDGYRLGQWVAVQRQAKPDLTEDQLRRLDDLGFVWNVLEEQWEAGYVALLKFKDREGHCIVPDKHSVDGYRLGQWVTYQRQAKPDLTEDRLHRLDELGFIWDARSELWEAGYAALIKFKNREGHCRVPPRHIDDSYRLGQWVGVQRENKPDLTEYRLRRLDGIGFVWDPFADKWEAGYTALLKFNDRKGNCLVAVNHVEDGYRLGKWCSAQRQAKSALTEDRLRRLDELGFIWDARSELWEAGYAALIKFKDREGHCRVPSNHVEDGYRLGQWCSVQKQKKEEMNTNRRLRLDKLCFIWDLRSNL